MPSTAILKLAVAFSTVCALLVPSDGICQDPGPDSSHKETREPVFRVPRIGESQSEPTSSTNSGSRFPDSYPENRIASNTGPAKPLITKPLPTEPGAVVSRIEAPLSSVLLGDRVADARGVEPSVEKSPMSVMPSASPADLATNAHPLDRAVEVAKQGLENMQQNVADYTAILVKRERVGNTLTDPNYMRIKIRNPREIDQQQVPFSIYMKFLKPKECAGREVIWVQGRNDNNLIAHETTPLLKFKNFHLDPAGFLAMKGNKYPIYDAGLENLIVKLIEKAERDREAGQCEVNYVEGAHINKRPCNIIEVIHHQKRPPYEFHIAKVFIDDEYNIPVRYISYDWPKLGHPPQIIEEYTYINVELNVGLTDRDFDIANSEYNFAR